MTASGTADTDAAAGRAADRTTLRAAPPNQPPGAPSSAEYARVNAIPVGPALLPSPARPPATWAIRGTLPSVATRIRVPPQAATAAAVVASSTRHLPTAAPSAADAR